MPTHYALSEAVLVIVAALCMRRLGRSQLMFAAGGAALFGFAAALGTLRFGLGLGRELSGVHRFVSQNGGVVAMGLITADCLRMLAPNLQRRLLNLVLLGVIVCSLLASVMLPVMTIPLILGWSVLLAVASFFLPAESVRNRLAAFGLAALFPVNALVVRQSPLFTPELSWHLYHIVIAVWLAAICLLLCRALASIRGLLR
tara:strand:+ start:837 stop:1439 length:603 start_codon:yes stop_codon:yes gene_type:complete